ncbi:MAG TPA: calcium/sodium antiporter, partial [Microbacteriaceae bacterium]
MISALIFTAGLVALIIGGETIVRAGSKLAARIGVSPMVIGLTVVSLGTSAPEMAISINAALRGNGELAIANITGTNTLTLLLILGITALIAPIKIQKPAIRLELPVMVIGALALFVFALDLRLDVTDGIVIGITGIIYFVLLYRNSRQEMSEAVKDTTHRVGVQSLILLAGLIALIVGSDWMVTGAVEIATALGVSEAVIGLTIVSIGTSAPEIVTSIIASIRKQRDLAVGNLLGSVIFNVSLVGAIAAMVAPGGIDLVASTNT